MLRLNVMVCFSSGVITRCVSHSTMLKLQVQDTEAPTITVRQRLYIPVDKTLTNNLVKRHMFNCYANEMKTSLMPTRQIVLRSRIISFVHHLELASEPTLIDCKILIQLDLVIHNVLWCCCHCQSKWRRNVAPAALWGGDFFGIFAIQTEIKRIHGLLVDVLSITTACLHMQKINTKINL